MIVGATEEKLTGKEITFHGQQVWFSGEEYRHYSRLFKLLDTDEDKSVGGVEAAAFIRRARLSDETNRGIWRLACGGKSEERLSEDGWAVAMKLVALAQISGSYSMEPLVAREALPLANFYLDESASRVREPEQEGGSVIVKVTSPKVIGTGYSRYVEYTVITETNLNHFPLQRLKVQRRFSDFKWMHQRLGNRFLGTIIPPIPGDKWMGNLESTFVEERRQSLEHYINQIGLHPELRGTVEFQAALTASPDGFCAAKELLELPNSQLSPTSSVSYIWNALSTSLGVGMNYPVAIDNDEELTQIEKRIDVLEQKLSSVVTTSDFCHKKQREYGYELCRFGTYMSALAVHEREDEAAAKFLEIAGLQFEHAANLLQDDLDTSLGKSVIPLRYQLGKVGAVKAVMRNREQALLQVQEANSEVQQSKERFAAARARSDSPALTLKAQQDLAKAEQHLEDMKNDVKFIGRNLKSEVARFEREKVEALSTMLLLHAKEKKAFAIKSQQSWKDSVKKLGVDDSEMEASRAKAAMAIDFSAPGSTPKSSASSITNGWLS